MTDRGNSSSFWPWVIRIVLALAALAAPIITFKAFTDSDAPDPVRQQRLREADDSGGQKQGSRPTNDPNLIRP